MNHSLIRLFITLACLTGATAVPALSTDKDQPISIEADSADIDDNKGISVYKGNVVVTQGSLSLWADTVTVHSPNRNLQKLVAQGTPARFQQRPNGEQEDMRAQARKMEYSTETEKLLLLDGAHLWQSKNEFSGNRIEYDTVNDTVTASKAPSGKERVQVIIQPKAKPNAGSAPTPPTSDSP